MLSNVLGFTVLRSIPSNLMYGVSTGAYKVCGGVIRNSKGAIVAHLINNESALKTPILSKNLASSILAPLYFEVGRC